MFLIYEKNYISGGDVDCTEERDFALFQNEDNARKEMQHRKETYENDKSTNFTFMENESDENCSVFAVDLSENRDDRDGEFHICIVKLPVKDKVIKATDILTKADIDLYNKLDNLSNWEISENIYEKCKEPTNFKRIEDRVWSLLNDPTEPFVNLEYFRDCGNDIDTQDEHEFWSGCLYNCDLIYMRAIAYILNLPEPKTASNTYMFN